MGLDNGIIIKIKNEEDIAKLKKLTALMKDNPFNLSHEEPEAPYESIFHVVYWRKWYGLDRDISIALHMNELDEIKLDREDLVKILRIYIDYLTKEGFSEDCIWEYEECIPQIKKDIVNLVYVLEMISDYDVYFYRSY